MKVAARSGQTSGEKKATVIRARSPWVTWSSPTRRTTSTFGSIVTMSSPHRSQNVSLQKSTGAAIQPTVPIARRGRRAVRPVRWVAEVSGYLVGSAAFKAVGTGDPRPAGSIPVHLRQRVHGRPPPIAEIALTRDV